MFFVEELHLTLRTSACIIRPKKYTSDDFFYNSLTLIIAILNLNRRIEIIFEKKVNHLKEVCMVKKSILDLPKNNIMEEW